MSRLRVHCFSVSLDGFGAGAEQGPDNPLGIDGRKLHEWFDPTPTSNSMSDDESGQPGLDAHLLDKGFENIGAWIMGRNMFGPIRGDWPDDTWKGWWGDDPPFHCDVYILTHHKREPVVMEGGTVFHFVTEGIYAALDRARQSANGKDVRLGGGVYTIRQYLEAGLVDEMHIAVIPVILEKGERLFGGLDLKACGLCHLDYMPSDRAAHYVFKREAD